MNFCIIGVLFCLTPHEPPAAWHYSAESAPAVLGARIGQPPTPPLPIGIYYLPAAKVSTIAKRG